MYKAGTWTFIDRLTGAQTTVVVNDTTPSKIKAAFVAAQAVLSGADFDKIEGYDPAGHPARYSSTRFNANFTS